METKRVCINIYNFIRMSHVEPTRFIQDDFDTIRNQIIILKQFGFPGTFALKYDALMDPNYQALLKQYVDEDDEISAWWEITSELCRRSGVAFRDSSLEEDYDDRVDSAYSIGYSPEERIKLVDGYMEDFYSVFGKYPRTIGSWVLDTVTLEYAARRYGIVAGATCRDQIGVDGFTLWGGYPTGAYYPSLKNENVPAQDPSNQLSIPVFRLLGPDPIYNFESDVRDDLQGVYTLEPAWITGRDRNWIRWMFNGLTDEDTIGMGYAQVGQENNFLWENIRPGYAPQFEELVKLRSQGKLRIETMEQTANWFRKKYSITPPVTIQTGKDWNETFDLKTQWYACANYRLSLLQEKGHLRIRDLFLYNENYASRYLEVPLKSTKSIFDALPVLYPQLWKPDLGVRPFIRLLNTQGEEPCGNVSFRSIDSLQAAADFSCSEATYHFNFAPNGFTLTGGCTLHFDALPVLEEIVEDRVCMLYEGFRYSFRVAEGVICQENGTIRILPENGCIRLELGAFHGAKDIYTESYLADPDALDTVAASDPKPGLDIPALAPEMIPGDSVFRWGDSGEVELRCADAGVIRYTLDGSDPTADSPVYTGPIVLTADCVLSARLYTDDGRVSDVAKGNYYFCLRDLHLESPTQLDKRPVFYGDGITDLLNSSRATTDYLDGVWRGTLQDVDVTCTLAELKAIASVGMGFLSHHRSGIVFPESLEIWVGPDKDHLVKLSTMELPCQPCEREIVKKDFVFPVHQTIGAFRFVAHRYKRMPQWCTYRGTETVFTMADSLLVVPE